MTDVIPDAPLEKPEPVRLLQRTIVRLVIGVCLLAAALAVTLLALLGYARGNSGLSHSNTALRHSNTALRGEVSATKSAAATAGEAKAIAACVNAILASRTGPSVSDATAHIEFAMGIENVLSKKISYGQFLLDLHSYIATLQTDQTVRNDNPLGKC